MYKHVNPKDNLLHKLKTVLFFAAIKEKSREMGRTDASHD